MKQKLQERRLCRLALFILALVATGALCCGCSLLALRQDKKMMELWAGARRAYEKQDYQAARELYRQIIARGYVSAELLFNLGNCAVRLGDMPNAVLFYRWAWYYAPSDPDIRANLAFALSATGAEEPRSPNPAVSAARKISAWQWVFAVTFSVWSLCTAGAIYLIFPKRPLLLRRVLWVLSLFLVISLFGLSSWVPLFMHPEAVTTAATTPVYYAPIPGSTLHFYLPQGSIVTVQQQADNWAKISAGTGREGWVQREHLLVIPFLPSQAGDLL